MSTIRAMQLETPLGTLCGGATDQGICFIEFMDRVKPDAALKRMSKELQAPIEFGGHEHLTQLEEELRDYFDRKRKEFTVPLHLTGTDFQKSIWQSLLNIPYGKTWTYKQQALHLQQLPAIRAIASANGQNKHAILLPCHRVIGSNGSLTGYAGGLEKKDWLLKFESNRLGLAPELPFE